MKQLIRQAKAKTAANKVPSKMRKPTDFVAWRDSMMPAMTPATELLPKTQAVLKSDDLNDAISIVVITGARSTTSKVAQLVFGGAEVGGVGALAFMLVGKTIAF